MTSEVRSIDVNYDEQSDVTAVRVQLFTGDSLKGAAFCSPHDEAVVRVGIFEAIIDAVKDEPMGVVVDALRLAVEAGFFALAGDWESESIEQDIEQQEREKGIYCAGRLVGNIEALNCCKPSLPESCQGGCS